MSQSSTQHTTPTILSIAGSDPSAGAGIQADLKTITALGGYALTVPTALTAQNTQGVSDVFAVAPSILKAQLHSIFNDFEVDAIKLGMLANEANIEIVLDFLNLYPNKNVVLDTVLISSSGHPLLEAGAIELLKQELIPRVKLITPNLPELNHLLGAEFNGSNEEMNDIAQGLAQLKTQNAVLKGGHILDVGDNQTSVDFVFESLLELQSDPNAIPMLSHLSAPRIETLNTHGTGCTLSSGIASYLAKGHDILDSVHYAKRYLTYALQQADDLQPNYTQLDEDAPMRHGPLQHFPKKATSEARADKQSTQRQPHQSLH